MAVVYPSIDKWFVPASALQASLGGVAPDGGAERSGGLWLGSRDSQAMVTSVVLPRDAGAVVRSRHWELSPEIVAGITAWARARGLVMVGMIHLHPGRSVQPSWSDRNRVVRVPGMLSVIVGRDGRDRDPDTWGWHLFEHGDYREMASAERRARISIERSVSCSVWEASEAGVEEVAVV